VTETGDIKAVNSTDIKCEVEGRTAIVNIVPEGTYITAEDVRNGKVLVELDSSKLREELAQRQIDLAAAEANHAEAREAYEIQVKQNESDITAAGLKVRFALIDLQKYVGEQAAGRLLEKPDPNADSRQVIATLLQDPNRLGGEAQQKLRELTGAITLAEANLQNAIYTLEWTQKLRAKEYVAETQLQRDRLDKQRLEIEREKAQIARDLFMRYEFPKEVEKLWSDHEETRRELERTEARSRSQLAQTKAKLTGAEATLSLRQERLEKVRKQLAACVIKAPGVGQVVYRSSTERWSDVKIEQGAEVTEGYKIITIPDTSEMKVEVKIHETWIDKIQPGQAARITIAAFPDKTFTGKVLRKAPLADLDNWLNPDRHDGQGRGDRGGVARCSVRAHPVGDGHRRNEGLLRSREHAPAARGANGPVQRQFRGDQERPGGGRARPAEPTPLERAAERPGEDRAGRVLGLCAAGRSRSVSYGDCSAGESV
jgi:HlyD family secretion protein